MSRAIERANETEEAVRRALTGPYKGPVDANSFTDIKAVSEPPQFVGLSEKLAESLVEAAQAQFNVAEQKLKEAQLFAEKLRQEVRERAESIHDLKVRLEDFGSSVLSAHHKFHGEDKKPPKGHNGVEQ